MKQRLSFLREFSVPLISGVLLALLWANLDPAGYHHFNNTPLVGNLSFHFLSNDIFMVLFFGIETISTAV